jgi:hypothetical protein
MTFGEMAHKDHSGGIGFIRDCLPSPLARQLTAIVSQAFRRPGKDCPTDMTESAITSVQTKIGLSGLYRALLTLIKTLRLGLDPSALW